MTVVLYGCPPTDDPLRPWRPDPDLPGSSPYQPQPFVNTPDSTIRLITEGALTAAIMALTEAVKALLGVALSIEKRLAEPPPKRRRGK